MNIDFISPESWQSLCDHLSGLVGISKKNSLRVYNSSYSAIYEAVVGTAQFMSHKRSIAAIKGMSPHVPKLLPYFFKEAYAVQAMNRSQILSTKEWVESLKKDTLLVVYAEDHPVTGELFDYNELDLLLNEKKIFSIRISYSSFWQDVQTREERPYSVRVCGLQPNLAFAIAGERFKSPSLTMPEIPQMSAQQVTESWKKALQEFSQDQNAVEKFEAHLPKDFLPWPVPGQRLYDRAVVYHPELNGEALQQQVAKELGISLASVGFEKQIETTNLCRWRSQNLFSDWWEHPPKEEILRGLLLISVGLLQKKDLATAMEAAAKDSFFQL